MSDPHSLLGEALVSSFGIVVATSDPVALKNRLYRIMKGVPEYDCLALITSPSNPKDEIWIVRTPKETPNADAETYA